MLPDPAREAREGGEHSHLYLHEERELRNIGRAVGFGDSDCKPDVAADPGRGQLAGDEPEKRGRIGAQLAAAPAQAELAAMPPDESELERELVQQRERCALLTENVSDFIPLVQELATRDEDHWGVVFSSPVSMPRGTGTIGLVVEALDRLLSERRAEDGLLNQVWWLQSPE